MQAVMGEGEKSIAGKKSGPELFPAWQTKTLRRGNSTEGFDRAWALTSKLGLFTIS
jgi:hypothetical protein